MVKKHQLVMICILFVFLTSCCYRGRTNEYNQIRTYIKLNSYRSLDIYKLIDTLVIYELDSYFYNNQYYKSDINQGNSFLKFYGNCKLSSFINIGKEKNHIYTRENFEPKNSRMGHFFVDEKKIIRAKIAVYNQCQKEILRCRIDVANDTLVLEYDNESINKLKEIYIKKNIKKELLEDWQPDW